MDATRELGILIGSCIGKHAPSGLVIALLGDLGAGKTTLTQALANALGIEEVVSSPTFLMLNEYHSGSMPLYHFDLYRLQEDVQSSSALYQLKSDLDESLMGGACAVVEWLNLWEEFAADYDQLRIELKYLQDRDGREALLSAQGAAPNAILQEISQRRQVST